MAVFVRHGKASPAFCPAGSQHPPAVCRTHPLPEPVLIPSFSLRRL